MCDFQSGMEYVKSFVKETRVLHRGDACNEERRAQSLGYNYLSENLQPECLRDQLKSDSLYLTAVIPIYKETYKGDYSGKRPSYQHKEGEFISEGQVFGILTPKFCGQLPPLTIC